MRIAVFGDIHGNRIALEAVLEDLAAEQADVVVCLGDLAFRGPEPAACVARVRALGLPCVHGNTDLALLAAVPAYAARVPNACRHPQAAEPYLAWHRNRLSAEDLDYVAGLPFAHQLQADGVTLRFVHAAPQDCVSTIEPQQSAEMLRERLAGLDADWLIMGHIHRAFAFRFGDVLLINAGAVGFSLDGDGRASYALLEPGRGRVQLRRVAYDVDRAVAVARERGFCFDPEWYGQRLRAGWWPPVSWERLRPVGGPGARPPAGDT